MSTMESFEDSQDGQFMNNPLEQYNRWDAEDCEACEFADDQYPYHRGVDDGLISITRLFAAVAADPEPYFYLHHEIRRGATR